MKRFVFFMFSFLIIPAVCLAQEYTDVVYLKNGSIIRGVIIEQIPNQSLKIQTSDGSVFVYKMEEVEKMTKEKSEVKKTDQLTDGFSNYDLGGCLIAWFSGTVWIEGNKADKQSNFFLHVFFDYYVVEKFAIGMYINKSLSSALEDETGLKDNMFEIGMSLKPRFRVNEKFYIKPGLNLGYRVHGGPDYDTDEKVKGFGINFTLEGQYVINENGKFTGEFGFLSQPTGGNDFIDMTYAPILMIGMGYTYSF